MKLVSCSSSYCLQFSEGLGSIGVAGWLSDGDPSFGWIDLKAEDTGVDIPGWLSDSDSGFGWMDPVPGDAKADSSG